jgi:hypothetical protein
MTAFTAISGAAAAVRARILANASTLGNIAVIKDRDEDPAVIADNAIFLPMACVIPLGDAPDKITFTMGGTTWLHDFDMRIVSYYRFSMDNKDPFVDLATVREYSYSLLELFRGADLAGFYPGCNVKDATIDIGYFMVTDYVIYRADIKLGCTMYEST